MVAVRVFREALGEPRELAFIDMEVEENPRIPGWPLVPEGAEEGDEFFWEGNDYRVRQMNNGILGTFRIGARDQVLAEALGVDANQVENQAPAPPPRLDVIQVGNAAPQGWWLVDDAVVPVRHGGLADAFRLLAPKEEPEGLRGEELFKLLLSGIKEVYGVDAVIAGGAVRDLVVGAEKTSNDVDIFIPMKWDDFMGDMEQLGWRELPVKVHNAYSKNKKPSTSNRAQGRAQGMLIDLVFMDKPLSEENVASFPVNAQKCIWTLDGGTKVSPEAQEDIKNKTFTISDKITHEDAIERIKKKVTGWKKRPEYKDWKMIEPHIKEWWEKKEKDEIPFEDKTQKTIGTSIYDWTTGAWDMWDTVYAR